VTLALGLGSPTITCTYSASSDKTSYVFHSCTNSNVAGDIVAASVANLTVVSADPSAPLTKIKAQLAYNALGDEVGTKLLPPIPTFWGTTGSDISAISVATNNDLTTAMNATASVHAVVFSDDITVADAIWTSNTDSGTVTSAGFPTTGGSASATLTSHVFGAQVEDPKLTMPGDLSVFPTLNYEHDFPVTGFDVWIFDVTVDIDGILNLTTTGNISTTAENIVVTPSIAVGVSMIGDVNLGIASGDIEGTVQLINVGTPITIGAKWTLDQVPGVCDATITGDINGQLVLSSLGGNITAEGTIGDCPFCLSGDITILDWKNRTLASTQIFDIPLGSETFPLSPSICPLEPLAVSIQTPTAGSTVLPATPTPVTATATRPLGLGNQPVVNECQFLTWSSSDPGATFTPPTGCSSSVTFSAAAAGTSQTITATATDPSGETGTASVTVSLPAALVPGPTLQFLSIAPDTIENNGGIIVPYGVLEGITLNITEVAPASSPPIFITVTCTDSYPSDPTNSQSTPATEPFGSTVGIDAISDSNAPTRNAFLETFGTPGIAGGTTPTTEIGQGPNTVTCVAFDGTNTSPPLLINFEVLAINVN
jgi:hypothetical protein